MCFLSCIESDNGNVHRAAAKIIVSKSRAARGSVCNVLLSGGLSRPILGCVLSVMNTLDFACVAVKAFGHFRAYKQSNLEPSEFARIAFGIPI